MKKSVFFSALAAIALSVSAVCYAGNAPAEASAPQTSTAQSSKVVTLKNDNKYRPGMKVKRLTILDFNATWCGPCKQFAPAFRQASNKFAGKVDFISIDTDINPQTAAAFGIQAIPTVIFLYPNGKTQRYVGTNDILPAETFIQLVQNALK